MGINKVQIEKLDNGINILVNTLAATGAATGIIPIAIAGGGIGALYSLLKGIGVFKMKSTKILNDQQEKAMLDAINNVFSSYNIGNKKKIFKYLHTLIYQELKDGNIKLDASIDDILAIVKTNIKKLNQNESLAYTEKDIVEFVADFKSSLYTELIDNPKIAIAKLLVDNDLIKEQLSDHEQRIRDLEKTNPYKISLKNISKKEGKIIGRKADIKNVKKLFESNDIVAINGMGGIGKSKLAKAIATSGIVKLDKTGWFDCEESLFDSLLQVADKSKQKPDKSKQKLDEVKQKSDKPNQELEEAKQKLDNGIYQRDVEIAKVKNYLTKLDSEYLIIFDNIEKLTHNEKEFIKGLKCKVIITTRKLFDGLNDAIETYSLNIMDIEDCKKMFIKYAHKQIILAGEIDDLEKIIKLAGHHSLVIELLAKLYNPPTAFDSIEQLYDKLMADTFDLSDLVTANGDTESTEFRKRLIKLFNISNIKEKDEIHVLKNICILPSLPVEYGKLSGWLGKEYKNAITKLYEAGWLRCENNTIVMHNVISETLKMAFDGEIEYTVCETMIDALENEIDKDISDPERYKAEYMPYCVGVGEYFDGVEKEPIAHLHSIMAGVYRDMWKYKEALEYYNKALGIREKVLGKEHSSTAITYNNIALVYQAMGEYKKALEYYNRVLEIREKVLGKEHPDTAITNNNMAAVYHDMGKYKKALEYYNKALEIKERILGKEHPDTAATYNNMAAVYHDMGEYKKALEYYNRALEIREKVLGKEHPNTATTYNNIALVYKDMGEYKKALEYYKKDKEISEKVLGKEHPSTAITYNNIALVYQAMGEYKKALEYYNKALEIKEKMLGKEHFSTATTYNNMAGVFRVMGEYKKALEYYNKALKIFKKVLGKEHPSTATTYNNIAGVYQDMGEYSKALGYYIKAFYIMLKVLGKDHPSSKIAYNNMVGCYRESGADMDKFNEWLNENLAKIGQENENEKNNRDI